MFCSVRSVVGSEHSEQMFGMFGMFGLWREQEKTSACVRSDRRDGKRGTMNVNEQVSGADRKER